MFNQYEDMKKLAVKLESPDASLLDSASTVKTESADVLLDSAGTVKTEFADVFLDAASTVKTESADILPDSASTVKTEFADVDDVYSLQEETIVKEEISIDPIVIRNSDLVYMQQTCKQELVHNTPPVASCSVDDDDGASDSPYLTLSDQVKTTVDYKDRAYVKIQRDGRPFNCEVCNKYFPLPSSLVTHMKVHTREQFHCQVCKKRFTQHADFIMHNKMKPMGRISCTSPYNCDVCYQRFKTSVNLQKHLRTHSGEGKFKRKIKCKLCKKCFTKNGYLTKHMKNMHT